MGCSRWRSRQTNFFRRCRSGSRWWGFSRVHWVAPRSRGGSARKFSAIGVPPPSARSAGLVLVVLGITYLSLIIGVRPSRRSGGPLRASTRIARASTRCCWAPRRRPGSRWKKPGSSQGRRPGGRKPDARELGKTGLPRLLPVPGFLISCCIFGLSPEGLFERCNAALLVGDSSHLKGCAPFSATPSHRFPRWRGFGKQRLPPGTCDLPMQQAPPARIVCHSHTS
jgi:hypothetical protein